MVFLNSWPDPNPDSAVIENTLKHERYEFFLGSILIKRPSIKIRWDDGFKFDALGFKDRCL